jgi:hypothetical protein
MPGISFFLALAAGTVAFLGVIRLARRHEDETEKRERRVRDGDVDGGGRGW